MQRREGRWELFSSSHPEWAYSAQHCLAFEASELHRQLEGGLMKQDAGNERFVLFGDNAYLNSPYMATPFTNVSGDENRVAEDSYNFYHYG